MKKLYPTFFVLLAVAFSFSCKKEISPDLEVTVVDDNNAPVGQVWVKTSAPNAVFGILESDVIDSAQTNMFGKVFFFYKNTRLIDSASVLLETKRKSRKSTNTTEKKLVFRN